MQKREKRQIYTYLYHCIVQNTFRLMIDPSIMNRDVYYKPT